jgi:UDP-3-O-acyl-N-acetylglucosamine deacetylase
VDGSSKYFVEALEKAEIEEQTQSVMYAWSKK